jgi:BA14K-like protein
MDRDLDSLFYVRWGVSKMFNSEIKSLTVILAVAVLPALSIPAAAVLPTQIEAIGNFDPRLEKSNLLTEVDSRYSGDGFAYRRYVFDNYYYHNRYYGHYHGYNNNYRVHLGGGGLAPGYGDGYRVYIGSNLYGGDYDYDDYFVGGEYDDGGHVEWCLSRYRNYNPRTDKFTGYDGHNHRCRSPY